MGPSNQKNVGSCMGTEQSNAIMTKQQKTTKKQGGKKRTLAIVLGVLAVLVVAAAVVAVPFMTTRASKAGTIYLSRGTSEAALTDSLTAHFGESFAGKVMTLVKVTGTPVEKRHGAWKVKQGESALSLARRLHGGASSSIKFTFNNLRTKREFCERAGQLYKGGFATFWTALNDPEVCKKYGKTPDDIIAIIIPDSYEFYWDVTPEEMLDKMYKYYNDYWDSSRKHKAEKLGLTPDQVEIIASITEEETAKEDERGKVGQLYINRYKAGMRLQADPTVKYALGDFSIKRLTNAMLQVQSPYNTYRVNGLPPGPIRLPEKSTIDAILNSDGHNYMYMCARPDFSGYHDFSTTYEEHLQKAHAYQQALDKHGIK